jgi:hypothetical protein
MSFHAFNEERAGERVMGLLREGKSIAVVTDAGTPVSPIRAIRWCAGPSMRICP